MTLYTNNIIFVTRSKTGSLRIFILVLRCLDLQYGTYNQCIIVCTISKIFLRGNSAKKKGRAASKQSLIIGVQKHIPKERKMESTKKIIIIIEPVRTNRAKLSQNRTCQVRD